MYNFSRIAERISNPAIQRAAGKSFDNLEGKTLTEEQVRTLRRAAGKFGLEDSTQVQYDDEEKEILHLLVINPEYIQYLFAYIDELKTDDEHANEINRELAQAIRLGWLTMTMAVWWMERLTDGVKLETDAQEGEQHARRTVEAPMVVDGRIFNRDRADTARAERNRAPTAHKSQISKESVATQYTDYARVVADMRKRRKAVRADNPSSTIDQIASPHWGEADLYTLNTHAVNFGPIAEYQQLARLTSQPVNMRVWKDGSFQTVKQGWQEMGNSMCLGRNLAIVLDLLEAEDALNEAMDVSMSVVLPTSTVSDVHIIVVVNNHQIDAMGESGAENIVLPDAYRYASACNIQEGIKGTAILGMVLGNLLATADRGGFKPDHDFVRRMIELKNNFVQDPLAYVDEMKAAMNRGDYNEARRICDTLLTQEPPINEAVRKTVLYNKSIAYQRQYMQAVVAFGDAQRTGDDVKSKAKTFVALEPAVMDELILLQELLASSSAALKPSIEVRIARAKYYLYKIKVTSNQHLEAMKLMSECLEVYRSVAGNTPSTINTIDRENILDVFDSIVYLIDKDHVIDEKSESTAIDAIAWFQILGTSIEVITPGTALEKYQTQSGFIKGKKGDEFITRISTKRASLSIPV